MTDADLGRIVNAAFDESGFVETIRERLRTAVAAVIGDDAADADVCAGRMAAEQLATILVAQGRDAVRARARRPGEVGHRSDADDVERRAAAFRTMAGVRA